MNTECFSSTPERRGARSVPAEATALVRRIAARVAGGPHSPDRLLEQVALMPEPELLRALLVQRGARALLDDLAAEDA
jgi:hypothetical protein